MLLKLSGNVKTWFTQLEDDKLFNLIQIFKSNKNDKITEATMK